MKAKSTADTHFCWVDNQIFIVVKVKLNDETQAVRFTSNMQHRSLFFLFNTHMYK